MECHKTKLIESSSRAGSVRGGVVRVGPEGKVGSEGSTEDFNRSLGWGVGEEIKGEVLKPSVPTSALLWNDRPAS